jgi:ABC-type glycerol-3-phosphate transport system substrate-binding protein
MTNQRLISHRVRRTSAVLATIALSLTAAACSSSPKAGGSQNSSGAAASGVTTISIDCAPPTSKPVAYQQWNADIATFEKAHPNIKVNSIRTNPCETPALFTAALAGGTEANVFYTYFTDKPQVLSDNQAADITSYVTPATVPLLNSINPLVLDTQKSNGKLYGIPYTNYTMGLIINRKLFTQAGLNPNDPPTTWAEVATDAKAITKLGNGIEGYGDYSAGNNGGWHFSAELDALGGTMENSAGTKANFDNALGKQVLQNLHDLRYTDNVMGSTQLLAWGTLQKEMAAGKLGMYIAAPDDITYMVQSLGANYADYGMGPIPSVSGTAAGTLSGGNDYMFNVKDTPAQIKAGVELVNFLYLTEGQGQFNYARLKATQQAVGLPEPELFTGAAATTDNADRAANATMPVADFTPYVNAAVPGDGEPNDAQAVYKVLDTAMASVLTDPNANINQLLSTASNQVNEVLANQ